MIEPQLINRARLCFEGCTNAARMSTLSSLGWERTARYQRTEDHDHGSPSVFEKRGSGVDLIMPRVRDTEEMCLQV